MTRTSMRNSEHQNATPHRFYFPQKDVPRLTKEGRAAMEAAGRVADGQADCYPIVNLD
jgi:hypothetical protein